MADDRRTALAEWFPVYLQYLGSVLACVLIGATIFGRADLDWAPAWIAIGGMIGLKPVWDFGKEKPDVSDVAERWSHLDPADKQ